MKETSAPTAAHLRCSRCSSLWAAGGQFTITAAYTHAPAREISIYDYSQLIFSTTLGFFLFGDIPDMWSFIGYAVIIAMAVVNFIYNDRSRRGRHSSAEP